MNQCKICRRAMRHWALDWRSYYWLELACLWSFSLHRRVLARRDESLRSAISFRDACTHSVTLVGGAR